MMLNINTLTLLSLAAGGILAHPFWAQKRAADGLNAAATAAGKLYFGSATDNGELTDTAYKAILDNSKQFGQITPANSMKWDTIEPSRGTFDYTKGDVIAELATANEQKLRCHTLVWYNQLPSWISEGAFDNATLVEILQNHITEEVTHYKGKCYAWDVVNEAISDSGDGSWRDNIFYQTIGEAYIPIAFAAAAKADPDAKLYYNDYSIESAGAKSTAAQDIVKLVQSYGAKIDGVGLQSHFIVGSTPSTEAQVANMKAFIALGVDVAITELDIRTDAPDTTTYESQQADDYVSTVNACSQVDRCIGITIWDYTDKYSWVSNTFSSQGAACPWDENLKTKPAYDAMIEAYGKVTPVPSSTSAAASATSALSASKSGDATTSPTMASSTKTASAGTPPTSSASESSTEMPATTGASNQTTKAPVSTSTASASISASSTASPSSATVDANAVSSSLSATRSATATASMNNSAVPTSTAPRASPKGSATPANADDVSSLPTTLPMGNGECVVEYYIVDA